jgi:two-component system response regulator FixJ
MTTKPTIYVVDDDADVRDGLKALLAVKGFGVETFASAEAFLADIAKIGAGCVLVDVRMPGMSGLELQRELKKKQPMLPVVIITGHGDVPMAVAALKAGAVDFIEKPFDTDALLGAIDEAMLRAAAARPSPDQEIVLSRIGRLTPRERQVMDPVVAGQPNKVIADRLQIAVRTVEIHRARVMDKMEARSLSDLVRMALRIEQPA